MMHSSERHPTAQSEVRNEAHPHSDQTIETLAVDLTQELHPHRQISGTSISILRQSEILERCLVEAYTYFSSLAEESLVITYGGEWLLDNYFIVQRAIQQLTRNMPPRYYARLPKVASGDFAGYAHVYVLAQSLTHHVQSRVTIEEQRQFVDVYQQHNTLKIGELWAWPTMLRITILETLVEAISQLIDSEEVFQTTLVAPIFRERFPILKDPDLIVANCVTSLRAIDAYDWSDFVEEASYVEKILQRDPAGIYTQMDFETRDCYRRQIEKLAAKSPHTEEEIAEAVLSFAQESTVPRSRHVGYFLIDNGLAETKKRLDYKPSLRERVFDRLSTDALTLYVSAVVVVTGIIMVSALRYALLTDSSLLQLISVLLIIIIPAISIATGLINWMVSRIVPPATLPKMDFPDGIPDEFRSMVVIPALLTSHEEVQSLADQLEQHYLRNKDQNLSFAILADFVDSDEENSPEDALLTERAVSLVNGLNNRYRADNNRNPFYFFLRERQWNPAEEKWMGYERKRGKLSEFNHLLLNLNTDTSYIVKLGNLQFLSAVRYVITLDADTILPPEAASRLIATMAHPLNQAQFSEDNERVTSGYTVLQPRVEVLPSAVNQTGFTRIFSGERGLDLYTLAVSNVYQDLFGEGIYVGKGIYDVAAFERSLQGRTPENALLSHDLFEGLHGRAGLVTDVVLLEDYPTHYLAHIARVHRWIRGDWQLLPWLFNHVPGTQGKSLPNNFKFLDRWKILDNLIRSLLHPALLLMIISGWLWLPGTAVVWTVFAMLVLLIPVLTDIFNQVSGYFTKKSHAETLVHGNVVFPLLRWFLSLAFLPYEALIRIHAITLTLRRLWSRKHLLEWQTAASVIQMYRHQSTGIVERRMLGVVLFASGLALIAFFLKPASIIVSLPMVLAWLSGPRIAERISQHVEVEAPLVDVRHQRKLRALSRRTWLFFEEFVGPSNHWLPPDHYQQAPIGKVGQYTSPTNIGLMLVSVLAAFDQGYIGPLDMMTRLQFAFESLSKLERYRGQLLNWYSTINLSPLQPRYVSTVDNGNFAASLLVLLSALDEFSGESLARTQQWEGLLDLVYVLDEIVDEINKDTSNPRLITQIKHRLAQIIDDVEAIKDQPHRWVVQLDILENNLLNELNTAVASLSQTMKASQVQLFQDLRVYFSRFQHHLSSFRRVLTMFSPWLGAFTAPPNKFATAGDELGQLWMDLTLAVNSPPPFAEIGEIYDTLAKRLQALTSYLARHPFEDEESQDWCEELQTALERSKNALHDIHEKIVFTQESVQREFDALNFGFLYDERRHLFHIGYNIDKEQLDNSYYDLLASESRIASFLAIAKRDVSPEHWLHLSRPVAFINHIQTLRSWSGTMFEYLMPMLFMRNYANTLLDQSYKAVIAHQVEFGRQHNVPWGVSESGYYAFDSMQNYQYRAFGLSTLSLRRENERDVVIAPYASLLALSLAPGQVLENLDALSEQDALTSYGLVESIDYTASRLSLGQERARVMEYMAHHQGMTFVSIANYLYHNVMVERFHRNPLVKSVELLLMEQIPQNFTEDKEADESVKRNVPVQEIALHPWTPETVAPQVHYLSNGNYAVMITNSGSGYSQWKNRALTRWRADTTLDNWGQWVYLYEASEGNLWSPTIQPLGQVDSSRVMFHLSHVEFQSRAYDISTNMEVFVPPNHDLEIRKLALTNHTEDDRDITICTYGEMVLAPQSADQRHQAFNKMFIESEYLDDLGALLFCRRLRASDDKPMFVLHMLIPADGTASQGIQFETDRRFFLGRNRTYRNPIVFASDQVQLSGTTGATLDPIMALARTVTIPAYSNVTLAFITVASDSRDQAIALAQRFRSWDEISRAQIQLRHISERELRHLNLKVDDIARYQVLLSSLLYPNPRFRAPAAVLESNTKAQSGLWAYGVSGDFPILLVQISGEEQLDLVYEVALAHRFWRNRGVSTTLVILNQRDTGYMQELYQQIHRLLIRTGNETWLNRHDGIFILRSEQMTDTDRTLLRSAARVLLDGNIGSLQQQVDKSYVDMVSLPSFNATLDPQSLNDIEAPLNRPENLVFDNGFGGFTEDGHEYQIYLDDTVTLPAPWINVIANPDGGFFVSESGGGFTWAENSGEHRLTAWRNDPVEDMPSEALYIRDEETAEVWSPTPMPAGTPAPYLIRHGAGYSEFEHKSHGLEQTTRFYMAPDAAVKFVRVKLKNTASRPRRITITYYLEWVLGPLRDMTQQYLIPEFDSVHQTMLVHNPYSMEFGEHFAFVTADQTLHGFTSDRTEFIGSKGSLCEPAALKRIGLNSTIQAGKDICSAVQLHVNLPLDGEAEICFIVGSASSRTAALNHSKHYREPEHIEQAWQKTREDWRNILDSIVVHTPDKTMDFILPWLLYQTLSCRIWGRSALYQSSGAFGFRDQLQDVMALVHVRPDLVQEHILRAAQHQFEEGDVLHWWHPPSGRGVRTRFSDDLVWLPFVVSHYIRASGDDAILQEEIPFLRGEELRPEEEERYGFYESTAETYTLYEHCRRALNRAYVLGPHTLPLIKAGDWNDGMNRVGVEGRGESVWMAWFLHMAMELFEPICRAWEDNLQADQLRLRMNELKSALETSAWDGQWYRRAYYDDGTPLGSMHNVECQIDSLPQSWSVFSGVADENRIESAMKAVRDHLIQVDAQLIQLFSPPFSHTEHDPGYIKGYPPGIRENGGQYTHAAIWVIWAFAQMGKGNVAESLFRLINPIYHSNTSEKATHYRVEPYVVVADIYSIVPHTGRGGWTWYTGSSGWMYRLGVEAILGIQREGTNLRIDPATNAEWERYEVEYRFGETVYTIQVLNPDHVERGVKEVLLEGELLESNLVPLVDDGLPRTISVVLG